MPESRYLSLRQYARQTFGAPLIKIPIDAGQTCPNRDGTVGRGGCVYCDPSGSGTGAAGLSSVAEQLESGLGRVRARVAEGKVRPRVVAYFQAFSNTHAPVEKLAEVYRPAFGSDEVDVVAIGTRPDCVGGEVLDFLSGLNRRKPIWLELGLQSASDETLQLINRGHTADQFADAARRASDRGFLLCAHVIVGLPGEDLGNVEETARFVAGLPVGMVKIHTLYVAYATELARWYEAGRFEPWSREDTVEGVIRFLELTRPEVVIARLTGDPRPGELIAPDWAADKAGLLRLIRDQMETQDRRQGRKAGGPGG
jgi:radical SAM protein (TIGR01212 family)